MSMVIRWLAMLVWVVWAGVGMAQESDPGEGYFQRGQFEQAAEVWEKRLMELSPTNSPEEYVDVSVQLATVYQSLGRLQRALEVLQSAESHVVKISQSTKHWAEYQSVLFGQLSDVYLAMGDLEDRSCQLISKTGQSVRQQNREKANEYLENAQKLVKQLEDSPSKANLQANLHNKQANIYVAQKNYEGAL